MNQSENPENIFNETHRNELFAYLNTLNPDKKCQWLKWWKHYMEVALKGEKCL